MKFRRQSREEVGINLTPLIDIVFLLLIFFMVSTTFTKETQLSIDLPEAKGQPKENVERQIDLPGPDTGQFRDCVQRQPLGAPRLFQAGRQQR